MGIIGRVLDKVRAYAFPPVSMDGRTDTNARSEVDHSYSILSYSLDADGKFHITTTSDGLLNSKVLAPYGPPVAVAANGALAFVRLGDDNYDAFIITGAYNSTVGAETLELFDDNVGTTQIADDTVWAAAGWETPPDEIQGVMLYEAYSRWATGAAGTYVVVQRYRYQ